MTPSRPAEIYYTTDNSTPYASSIKYTGPIIINTTTTLRYIAIDSDGIASEAYYKVYVVDSNNSLTGYRGQILGISMNSDSLMVTVKNTGSQAWYPEFLGQSGPTIGLKFKENGEERDTLLVQKEVQPNETYTFDNAVGNLHERTGSQDLTFILKTGNWDQIVTVLDQVTKQINLDGSI